MPTGRLVRFKYQTAREHNGRDPKGMKLRTQRFTMVFLGTINLCTFVGRSNLSSAYRLGMRSADPWMTVNKLFPKGSLKWDAKFSTGPSPVT